MNRATKIMIPGEIHVADEPEFKVGRAIVRPAALEIQLDGERASIEPRVMQLLVAIARAGGEVVSRDSLIISCWGGRAVSEDAINRCVCKARRLAGRSAGFEIETINRVGYRLVEYPPERAAPELEPPSAAGGRAKGIDRRMVLGGGVAAAIAAATGFWLLGRQMETPPPPDVELLMTQARTALNQCTPEGNNQAIGLLRHVTELSPEHADDWATLAVAYAVRAGGRGSGNFEEAGLRARSAAMRALQLDPQSAYAKAALALLGPRRGRWLVVEQALRGALADRPREEVVSALLGMTLLGVGRNRDAAAILDPVLPAAQASPAFLYTRTYLLWAAGRMDEADQVMERGVSLYPTYVGLWFTRLFMLLSTGRAEEAIRLAENIDGRPSGIPAGDFDDGLVVAQALKSRRPADVDRAIALNSEAARHGVGYAKNLIQFAALLGRLDTAFEAAGEFYFGQSASHDAPNYSPEQRSYARAGDRNTAILFNPMTRAMRSDPRFEHLVTELGLGRYWAEAHVLPDYRSGNLS